jgi:outer membrane protein assembly factor BamB
MPVASLNCSRPGEIRALNPLTGAQVWSDNQIGGIHWESPIVANGMLYITDESGNLTAYALNGILPPVLEHSVFLPVIFR